MIQFKCRNCGTVILLKPEFAGKVGKCPKCATANRIPPPAALPTAIPIDAEGVAEPRVAREPASPIPPADFAADFSPQPAIDPDAWRAESPLVSNSIAKTQVQEKAAQIHPVAYAVCCLPIALAFVGGLIGGALGGGAAAINVAVCRSRLLLPIKAGLMAAASIAAVAVWLVAALAINGVFGHFGGFSLPGLVSGTEPVDADYCTILLAPKVRDELDLDAPQRVRLADKARFFRRYLAHPDGIEQPQFPSFTPMMPRVPGFVQPIMPPNPGLSHPFGVHGPMPATERRGNSRPL